MYNTSERPNRDIQQELVFQGIKNPRFRELLRGQIPSDKFRSVYGTDYDGQRNFELILKSDQSELYSHILAIASVAQNPNQLANAFQSLVTLAQIKYSRDDDVISKLDQAQNAFLGKRFNVTGATEGARELEARFLSAWSKAKGDVRWTSDIINNDLRPFRIEDRKKVDRFSAEAILLTLLDDQVPLEFRKAILQNFGSFQFANNAISGIDSKFASDASFWRSVDASWVLPELFGRGAADFQGDPKDKEIAELRSKLRRFEDSGFGRQPEIDPQEVVNLKIQLEAFRRQNHTLNQENYRLNQGNNDLRAENERLRRESHGSRLPAQKSPWDVLGLDRQAWDSASLEERRRMLTLARRPLLMKYHPDQHPSVQTDPVVKELLDEKAKEVNGAVDKLVKIYNLPRI